MLLRVLVLLIPSISSQLAVAMVLVRVFVGDDEPVLPKSRFTVHGSRVAKPRAARASRDPGLCTTSKNNNIVSPMYYTFNPSTSDNELTPGTLCPPHAPPAGLH